MMTPQFEKLTEQYLEKTDLAYRKSLGQYFTPRSIRDQLIARLPDFSRPKILDPACGSGEFLISARTKYPDCDLCGWEIDSNLVRLSRKQAPDAKITRVDALECKTSPQFDIIIGNPPYFEFKPTPDLRARYREVIGGRANIFSMFIKLGLDLLRPGGWLAYVVPPSMNNGAYFKDLRAYIIAHANIEYLHILSSPQQFDRATQSVMLLILRKGENRQDYMFERNGLTIFSPEPEKLRRAFRNKTTLLELGFSVRTGRIVWNQHREKLTNRSTEAIPLIRPFNITTDGLILENGAGKDQYIKYPEYDTGPAIAVNRVTGSAGNGRLKGAVIPGGMKFLAENHVNVIFPPADQFLRAQTVDSSLRRICSVINSEESMSILRLITGNTQVSRTELERLLPIPLESLGK